MKFNILFLSCMFVFANILLAQDGSDLSRIYFEYSLRHRNPYWHGWLGVPYEKDQGRLYHLENANFPHYYGYGQINGGAFALQEPVWFGTYRNAGLASFLSNKLKYNYVNDEPYLNDDYGYGAYSNHRNNLYWN